MIFENGSINRESQLVMEPRIGLRAAAGQDRDDRQNGGLDEQDAGVCVRHADECTT